MAIIKGQTMKVVNRHTGKTENCTVGLGCQRHFHAPNVKPNIMAESLLEPPYVESETSWEKLEHKVEHEIKKLLPAGYAVEGLGSSNSNTTDVKIMNSMTGEEYGVEVKQLPSAAGIQLVVEKTENGYVMTNEGQKNIPYLQKFLNLVNKHYITNNVSTRSSVKLKGEDKKIACAVFTEKYAHMSPPASFIAASTAKNVNNSLTGNKIAAVPTDSNSIEEAFHIVLTVRAKKSGSTRANNKTVEEFNRFNTQYGWGGTVKHFAGKNYVHNIDNVEQANSILKPHRLFINNKKELRKLGDTNNTTALMSLTNGDKYHTFEGNLKNIIQQKF
jgi:hypothetical protein